jgi:hypothetical protein
MTRCSALRATDDRDSLPGTGCAVEPMLDVILTPG